MKTWLSVGLANTFIGVGLIVGLTVLTSDPIFAHSVGYFLSAVIGVTMHGLFSFSTGTFIIRVFHSTIAFFVSWGISVFCLSMMLGTDLEESVAQVISIAVYTLFHFTVVRLFRDRQSQ